GGAETGDFEAWFHREWVRALFTRAVSALERRCCAEGRDAAFAVFRRYDLDVGDGARPTYEAVGRELGLPVTQVTNHLAAMRRELGREVALKVMNGPDPRPGGAARLRTEAQVLARLEHPGLVPVHDLGALPDGRLYYVMKLVRGRRLDEHVRDLPARAARLRV